MPISNILGSMAPGVGGLIGNAIMPGMGGAIGGVAGAGLQGLLSHLYPNEQQQGNMQQPMAQQGQMNQGMNNDARNYLLQQLMNPNQGEGSSFDPIEQRYRRQFSEQTLPRINNQFGGSGLIDSSSHRNSITNAETDLSERLAALRSQHQLQQNNMNQNRLGMLGQYLTGQGQLGLQGQQLGMQQQQQDSWWPSLSTVGTLGLGALGAYNTYNQNRMNNETNNRDLDIRNWLNRATQLSNAANNRASDTVYVGRTPGVLG